MAKESGRKYELKTKKQLIAELEVLYKRIAKLEKPGDVSEWSEEVLLQHELATCAAIEEMPDGVMLVDAGGKVLYINKACEKLLGYKTDELIGKSGRRQLRCAILNQRFGGICERMDSRYSKTGLCAEKANWESC